jgi:hypothetical protein
MEPDSNIQSGTKWKISPKLGRGYFVVPEEHEPAVRKAITWLFDTVKYAAIIGAVQTSAKNAESGIQSWGILGLGLILYIAFNFHINLMVVNLHVTIFQSPTTRFQQLTNVITSGLISFVVYVPVYFVMQVLIRSFKGH